jgi:hypothetical protein
MLFPIRNHPVKTFRIVIYRPHVEIWFKNPIHHLFNRERLPHKYEQFFDFLLASDAKISVATSLQYTSGFNSWLRSYVLEPIALIYWAWANRLSFSKLGFVFSKASLASHDVLLFMNYGNFTEETPHGAKLGKDRALALADVPIRKVGHFTHYVYQPAISAQNLSILGVDILFAENNLQKNSPFYRKMFGSLGAQFLTLPFVAAPRFQSITPFAERQCKLLATGSITYKIYDPDFAAFYGGNELQPLRRQIYENAAQCRDQIFSMISDLASTRNAAQQPMRETLLSKFVKKFKALLGNKPAQHPQHNYYSADIVRAYNTFKMFAVPEEICDLPAIGFVEGMACGAAYFGIDSPMYRDLGMMPGIHYVAYDGTFSGLISRIRYYQSPSMSAELQQIAEIGCMFVNEHLKAETVYDLFLSELRQKISTLSY